MTKSGRHILNHTIYLDLSSRLGPFSKQKDFEFLMKSEMGKIEKIILTGSQSYKINLSYKD